MTARRLQRWGCLAALASVALTGCKFEGAASFPLPGGEATGSDAYEVTVEFTDVLDLVRQSAVKVNDVTVGSVSDISLDGFTAKVKVRVRPDVVLPENARASLRQTSLLGEKFVSLERPTDEEPVGRLRQGDLIPLARTVRGTEIEEVLSALSLVLNGGSLEELKTINTEVVKVLEGRESKVKDVLTQLDTFVGGLDEQKQQIVRALDGLDKLTARLAAQRDTFAVALRDIPRGSAVLTEQRQDLVKVLQGLDRLGDVATRVIRASQQNTVADLRALEPILTQLNAAGKDLPRSLELLTTYPFPRTVVDGIKGDYANLFLTVDANLTTLGGNTGIPLPVPSLPVPLPTVSVPPLPGGGGVPAVPSLPAVPKAPAVPSLLPAVPGVTTPVAAGRGDLLGLLLGGLS